MKEKDAAGGWSAQPTQPIRTNDDGDGYEFDSYHYDDQHHHEMDSNGGKECLYAVKATVLRNLECHHVSVDGTHVILDRCDSGCLS